MFRINKLEIFKTSQSFKKPFLKVKNLKKIPKQTKLLLTSILKRVEF